MPHDFDPTSPHRPAHISAEEWARQMPPDESDEFSRRCEAASEIELIKLIADARTSQCALTAATFLNLKLKSFMPADFTDLAGGDPLVAKMLANQASYVQNPPAERDPSISKLVDAAFEVKAWPDDSPRDHRYRQSETGGWIFDGPDGPKRVGDWFEAKLHQQLLHHIEASKKGASRG